MIFETALLSKLESVFETSDYQFGFKSHHSTDLCIYTLYYTLKKNSWILQVPLDFGLCMLYGCIQGFRQGKPLDVIYKKKMIDSGMPPIFVRLIVTWYCEQRACVRWGSTLSPKINVSNGVR